MATTSSGLPVITVRLCGKAGDHADGSAGEGLHHLFPKMLIHLTLFFIYCSADHGGDFSSKQPPRTPAGNFLGCLLTFGENKMTLKHRTKSLVDGCLQLVINETGRGVSRALSQSEANTQAFMPIPLPVSDIAEIDAVVSRQPASPWLSVLPG